MVVMGWWVVSPMGSRRVVGYLDALVVSAGICDFGGEEGIGLVCCWISGSGLVARPGV